MPDWDQRAHDHAIVITLQEISQALDQLERPRDADEGEALERVRHVVARLNSLIMDADSELLSPGLLDETNTHLPDVLSELRTYRENHDRSWLDSVNGILDTLIAQVGWPLAYAATDVGGLREAAASYRRSAGQLIRGIEEEVEAARARVAELGPEVEAAKTDTAQAGRAATQAIEASAVAAEQRLATVTKAVDAEKARLDALTTEYQRTFTANEAARTSKSDEAVAGEIDKHQQARTAGEAAFETAVTTLRDEAATTLATLDEQKAQALTLVNATGAIAYSGSFGGYAAQQGKIATVWAIVAVVALVAVALFGGWQVLQLTGGVDSVQLILRLVVTIPVFALVALAAQQSGRHRENERRARRLELELAAIDPYLALLDEEQRKEIKAQVASRMFAQPEATKADASLSPIDKELIQLLKEHLKK